MIFTLSNTCDTVKLQLRKRINIFFQKKITRENIDVAETLELEGYRPAFLV